MLILCQSHRDPIQIPRASWDHCWMSQIIPISIPHHSRINPTSIPLNLSQIDPIKVPHRSHKFYPTSFPDRSHIDPTKIPHRCGIDVGSEIPVPESYTLVTQSHIDPKFNPTLIPHRSQIFRVQSHIDPTSIPHCGIVLGSMWDF
jgi:hypothetical protein